MYGVNAAYLNEAKLLEKKWAQVGGLDGIKDVNVRLSTAVLLENQTLVNERLINESDSVSSDDVAVFRRVTIPMVRRIYPNLIANKIVSVQPLIGPTGLVYYLRFRYGSTKGATTGSDTNNVKYGDSPNTGWDSNSMQQRADGTPVLDVYYTSQRVDAETRTVAAVNNDAAHTLQYTPPIPSSTSTGIEALSSDVTSYNGTTGAGAATLAAGSRYTIFGKAVQNDTTDKTYYFSYRGALPALNATVALTVSSNLTSGTLGLEAGGYVIRLVGLDHATNNTTFTVCYEYNMECTTQIPKVTMVLENEEIVAKTRKMKANWSWEASQDLRSQHSVDAEQEMTNILAQEINLEIDREIITNLRAGVGTIAMWDYASALGDTIKEKYESLYVKVVEVSNVIMKKTLRGGANWLVVSPEIASVFETATAGFAPAPTADFESALGIQYVGTINNRWKVYKDPLFPNDQILLGFKGDSLLDSGFFYCPYVPLQMTPTVLDPDTLCPTKGIMTRYGTKMLREGQKYYALIQIHGFQV